MSLEDIYWERTAHYGWFAERYGWTVAQVDEQPAWYTDRLAGFAGIVDEVNEAKQKAAQKK